MATCTERPPFIHVVECLIFVLAYGSKSTSYSNSNCHDIKQYPLLNAIVIVALCNVSILISKMKTEVVR